MENETRTLAELLVDTIRIKNISLEKLAQISGVSERFLNALLEGRGEDLPAAPYVRGYLMKLADVLGLNGEDLWHVYLKHDTVIRRAGKNDELPGNRFIPSKLKAGPLLTIGVIILLIILGTWFLPALFGGASLTIVNIEPNMIVRDPSFVIRGSMDKNDALTINGEVVYPKETGDFEYKIGLQKGFNTIEFKIKHLLGKETVVTKQIFYETPTSSVEQTIK